MSYTSHTIEFMLIYCIQTLQKYKAVKHTYGPSVQNSILTKP